MTLLGVHRPDEREARGVAMRDALALDMIDTHGRHIQEDIDEVVLEEVDLIDVEDLPMGAGEDAGGEAQLTRRQGVLHVDGAD